MPPFQKSTIDLDFKITTILNCFCVFRRTLIGLPPTQPECFRDQANSCEKPSLRKQDLHAARATWGTFRTCEGRSNLPSSRHAACHSKLAPRTVRCSGIKHARRLGFAHGALHHHRGHDRNSHRSHLGDPARHHRGIRQKDAQERHPRAKFHSARPESKPLPSGSVGAFHERDYRHQNRQPKRSDRQQKRSARCLHFQMEMARQSE